MRKAKVYIQRGTRKLIVKYYIDERTFPSTLNNADTKAAFKIEVKIAQSLWVNAADHSTKDKYHRELEFKEVSRKDDATLIYRFNKHSEFSTSRTGYMSVDTRRARVNFANNRAYVELDETLAWKVTVPSYEAGSEQRAKDECGKGPKSKRCQHVLVYLSHYLGHALGVRDQASQKCLMYSDVEKKDPEFGLDEQLVGKRFSWEVLFPRLMCVEEKKAIKESMQKQECAKSECVLPMPVRG